MPDLSPRQFGKVVNLADWRRGRPETRRHASVMTTADLHGHILDEHGVMPASDRPLTKAYLEHFHGELHQANPQDAPPVVAHTHVLS